jgi:ABC-type transport system involved in multi-copper enzyme maturation permease subunit
MTPWYLNRELAPMLYQLVTLFFVVLLCALVSREQAKDLTKGRPRHLFSLPITPAQIVVSKMVAVGLVSAPALVFLNLLWFVGSPEHGVWRGAALALLLAADQYLGMLLLWTLFLASLRIYPHLVFVVVTLSMVFSKRIPVELHPMSLELPLEAAGHSLLWARVLSIVGTATLLLIVERHLALKPVD